MLINPGIPNRDYYSNSYCSKNLNEPNSKLKKCSKCNIVYPKSLNVNHCEDCNVCVMGYDHHCPWTGKCIGKYNIIFFYFFLFSLFIYIFMSFFTFITFIIKLEENDFQNRRRNKKF